MNEFEDFRAGTEARRSVVDRTGDVARHERALQHYLIAAQFQQRDGTDGVGSRPVTDTRPAAEGPTAPEAGPEEQSAPREPRGQGTIVVGVDGSAGSDTAAGWAADEADRRNCALSLVHAYRLPTIAGYAGDNAIPDDLLERLRSAGIDLLDATAARLAVGHPTLVVDRTLFHGRADEALRRASEHAQLTVVGNAPAARAAGVLLGSVALAVTATNPAPVAVIHADHTPDQGPIVVGVDGSPLSEAAVAFAFDEAALRHTDLVAVHSWHDLYLDSRDLEPLLIDPDVLEQQERVLLSQRIAGWADKYPDVEVRQVVAHQRPTPALLEQSEGAQAVVVGSHGRGGFAGMLLGSTSHALLTHGHCPVIIVRTPTHSAG